MPTNLYGPGDNYDLATSHVLPALLRKVHEAKLAGAPAVTLWGTGSPLREFLHVDDLADACIFLVKNYSDEGHVNVGSGSDLSILDLTKLICRIVGYPGRIEHDRSKPDGTPRKLMDSGKIMAMGWRPGISLEQGVAGVYRSFAAGEEGARQSDMGAH